MKNLYYVLALCITSWAIQGQTETNENYVEPDFEIGNYGISLKTKSIGRYEVFDCSDEEYHAECVGYFKADDIDFNTTSLIFSGGEVSYIEDMTLDLTTLKVVKVGGESGSSSYEEEGLYIDTYTASTNLQGTRVIDSLKGYTHLAKQFFSKGDNLAYLDDDGFYKLNESHKIDIASFTPIINNLFHDENGVYYVEYGHLTVENQKYSDIIKLQDLEGNEKPKITLTDYYYIINNTVYDARRVKNQLLLDPQKIDQLILKEYSGKMLLFDDKTFYDKSYGTSYFDEALCETDYEKKEIQCLFPDLSTLKKLRSTRYTDYHLDTDNKTIYFNADKDLGLTEVSGNLYSIDSQFYFNDFDSFSLKLDAVQVWNPAITGYEPIFLEEYQYINDEFYYYKGNLYGNQSQLIHADFSLENARVLKTDYGDYIVNEDVIIAFSESKSLNLDGLKVLKTKSNTASNYLIGNDYLIYNNQVLEGVNLKDIIVLNKDILKTTMHLIIKGQKIALSTFPFEIVVIE